MKNTGNRREGFFDDAQVLLDTIIDQKLLTARAVYGIFPANTVGDDVELYTDASRSKLLTNFHFLRQQMEKKDGEPHRSLSDFIAPRNGAATLPDHIGAFAVSTGFGLKEITERFKADHDDYNAIMAEAIADRLAEAFAECLHKRVREEWGYGKDRESHGGADDRRGIPRHPARRRLSRLPGTIRKSASCGSCSTWKRTWASSSPNHAPCGRVPA